MLANNANQDFFELDIALHEQVDEMIRYFHTLARGVDTILAEHEKIKSIIRYDESIFE